MKEDNKYNKCDYCGKATKNKLEQGKILCKECREKEEDANWQEVYDNCYCNKW